MPQSNASLCQRASTVLVLMMLSAIWLCACPKPAGQPSGAPGSTAQPAAVAAPPANVQALDAPGNPYASQYAAWDKWAFAHLTTTTTNLEINAPKLDDVSEAALLADPPACTGELTLLLPVDANGFMIPFTVFAEQREQAITDGKFREFYEDQPWVIAKGPVDSGIWQDWFMAWCEIRAKHAPPVPELLAQYPALGARLLPNGSFVSYAKPGQYLIRSDFKECCGKKGIMVLLFDPNLQIKRGLIDQWWFLFYDKDTQPVPPGEMEVTLDGYVKFTDPTTGEPLSVWDYDGTQLEPQQITPRDAHNFIALTGWEQYVFYQLQHGLPVDWNFLKPIKPDKLKSFEDFKPKGATP
jgi:hypothetical protein